MRRIFVIVLLAVSLRAHADYRAFLNIARDPALEIRLRDAAQKALTAYPKLKDEDLAISVIDVTNPATISRADYHGDAPFYPASVIKLAFMIDVYATHKERIGDMDRALKEMITVSDNDATAYIVDILANTTPGPPLQGRALHKYIERRRDITQRFQRAGYTDNLNAMMKPWSFGPYGRDKQVLGTNRENRNKLSANATASLLFWIVSRRATGAHDMMNLLERPLAPLRADENQVKEFIGETLPAGSRLWSKAGWTSEVRHDAAYVELPDGRKWIVVIYTRGPADDVTLIPGIARSVF